MAESPKWGGEARALVARLVEVHVARLRLRSRMPDYLRSALPLTVPARFPSTNPEECEMFSETDEKRARPRPRIRSG